MSFFSHPIMIGAAAGLVAALLSIGLVMQTFLSIILFMASPLPIMLAGLGWGPVAGAVSALVFGGILYSAAGDIPALVSLLIMAVPASIGVYALGMARRDHEGSEEWFPLGTALFLMAIATGAAFVISGYIIGYGAEFTDQFSVELVKQLAASSPELAADPVTTISLANFVIRTIPIVQPAMWVAVLAANLWVALKLSLRSNLLRRPMDDWPMALRLPQAGLPLFALAMAGTFLDGGARMAVDVFVGALGMAFALSGLALFHDKTRGKPWRPAALWLGWLSLITVGLTGLLFLFAGLYASAKKYQTH